MAALGSPGVCGWGDIPVATREAVEEHTGAIRAAQRMAGGLNAPLTVLLTTETGRVFIKGLPRDHAGRPHQELEAAINRHVTHISPRLLWRVADEWDVLGFEAVDGRPADYRPGSPDLPLVVRLLEELGRTPCPDVPTRVATRRWRDEVAAEEIAWLDGDRLLHTDLNPSNVLIEGGRAWLVDWAWPTRGAGWIDPACALLQFMAAGHGAVAAEALVADLPAWRAAPAAGIAVFAGACSRMWAGIARADPAPWAQRVAEAADGWAVLRARG